MIVIGDSKTEESSGQLGPENQYARKKSLAPGSRTFLWSYPTQEHRKKLILNGIWTLKINLKRLKKELLLAK